VATVPLLARQRAILEITRKNGRATVDELSALLAVTPQTIRKDLNELYDQNLISRFHGGAIATSGVENLSYEARKLMAEAEKQAIGKAAAALIPDGASLFVNIGTTTEEVARALIERNDLLVITNNLNVVDILSRNRNIDLIVAGGRIRHSDRAAVGASAVEFIRHFKVDFAIIGASAIDEDGSLLDFDLNEVQVSQAILQNSRSVILAADHQKLGRPAPVRIGHFDEINYFVTDRLYSEPLRAVCEETGVQIVEAMPDRSADDKNNI
jgi:DeoR family transcriptional regulator, glycerol-3-phosphate regulon repressor